jgi:2-dehydro-3-deoxyphosphooctonate aldolase (KDO 8-P synthase)
MKLCGFEVGLDHPLFLIAGPCVIESEQMALDTAGALKEICNQVGIPFIYKSSFDKANRSSGKSFRGLGLDEGLRILSEVKNKIGVPVLTDVHTEDEIAPVAAVVDVLQTPAFLCRQTDFIEAVATCGKPVNIKKGQFLAPGDMKNVVDKAKTANGGADTIMVCDRGVSFGYNTLVSDMRGLAIMRETGCPVVYRRHPFGAAARRPGHHFRRPAGIRAGAGASRRGGGHRRPVRGNPSGPGHGPVRRPQRLAPASHEGIALHPQGHRRLGEAKGLYRSPLVTGGYPSPCKTKRKEIERYR